MFRIALSALNDLLLDFRQGAEPVEEGSAGKPKQRQTFVGAGLYIDFSKKISMYLIFVVLVAGRKNITLWAFP